VPGETSAEQGSTLMQTKVFGAPVRALAYLLLPLASLSCDTGSPSDQESDACAAGRGGDSCADRDDCRTSNCTDAAAEPEDGGRDTDTLDAARDSGADDGASQAQDASPPARDAQDSADAAVAPGRCGDGIVSLASARYATGHASQRAATASAARRTAERRSSEMRARSARSALAHTTKTSTWSVAAS